MPGSPAASGDCTWWSRTSPRHGPSCSAEGSRSARSTTSAEGSRARTSPTPTATPSSCRRWRGARARRSSRPLTSSPRGHRTARSCTMSENIHHAANRVDLGHGLEVSRLGFGGMAITHVYGETDPAEGLRTLHHAVDAGVTFIDTADVYGRPREGESGPAGTNEELVGELLRTRRDEVQLATKFGITGVPTHGPGGTGVRGDAAYVRSAAEASLRRLGTDVIDLYYLHRRDVNVPIEETVGAMAELVDAGKVRHLGLSEVTADELRAAAAVHPITAVQSEWSIWSRDVEDHVVPAAAELGVGFVPYSPLGRGFLTGTIRSTADLSSAGDFRKTMPRFAPDALDANLAVVQVVT